MVTFGIHEHAHTQTDGQTQAGPNVVWVSGGFCIVLSNSGRPQHTNRTCRRAPSPFPSIIMKTSRSCLIWSWPSLLLAVDSIDLAEKNSGWKCRGTVQCQGMCNQSCEKDTHTCTHTETQNICLESQKPIPLNHICRKPKTYTPDYNPKSIIKNRGAIETPTKASCAGLLMFALNRQP